MFNVKRILLGILSGFILFSSVGCMSFDSLSDRALNHIEAKYGRKFTPVFYENADVLSSTRSIECITDGLDPENERVRLAVMYDDDGKPYFRDDYFSYLVRPEFEEYIGAMIASEFSEYKVYREHDAGLFPDELVPGNTLEDLYRVNSTYWASVKVFIKGEPGVSDSVYQEKMQRIENLLCASGHRYTVYIFVVSPDEYESISRYAWNDFWSFYAENREPDGSRYYYLYHEIIKDGAVLE